MARLSGRIEEREQSIGSFTVTSLLGTGGMATVYAVKGPCGRTQALKITNAQASPWVERLYRERRALLRLKHPNIVALRDMGHHKGCPWYTMDVFEGPHIDRWADAHRLGGGSGTDWMRPILRAFVSLCDALDHTHRKGIIHRDLKPENVLMHQGTPRIIDFGLVTHFAGAGLRANIDSDSAAVGSAAYMAPEQVRGEIADPRADLYALGAILLRCLSGERPYRGLSLRQLLRAQAKGDPPRALEAHEAPAPLKTLITRLMAPRKEDRPRYALEVAATLEAVLGKRPEGLRPVGLSHLVLPPLVGRDSLVQALLQGALKGGGQNLWLLGEGGSGKTSVLNRVAHTLRRQGVHVLTTSGLHQRVGQPLQLTPPLSGLTTLLVALKNATDSLPSKRREVFQSIWTPLKPFWHRIEADKGTPPSLPPGKLFRTLTRGLTLLGHIKPTVLILDDVQWMDELTLSFLGWLGRSERDAQSRWALIASLRDGDQMPATIANVLGRDDVRAYPCPPLGPGEIQGLITLALGPGVGESKATELECATRGLPLFVMETLRLEAWERSRWSGRTNKPWTIPPTPKALWARRFGGLTPGGRQLLWTAAALGRPTPQGILQSLSRLDDDGMALALQELTQSGLLEETQEGVRLTHARLSDAAYSSIPEDSRRSLHRDIAACLKAGTLRTSPLELAIHHDAAGNNDAAKAAYREGAKLGRQHNERLWIKRCHEGLVRLSQPRSAERAQAVMAYSRQVLEVAGRLDEAEALLAKTLEEVQAEGLSDLEGHVEDSLGWVYLLQCTNAKAKGCFRRALALADAHGDKLLRCRSLNKLAAVLGDTESISVSIGLYEDALKEAMALDLKQTQAHILGNISISHLNLGNLPAAVDTSKRARSLAEAVGDTLSEGLALSNIAAAAYHVGNIEEAILLAEEALVLLEATNAEIAQSTVRSLVGAIRLDEGRPDLAEPMLLEASSYMRDRGLNFFEAQANLTLSRLYRLAHNELDLAQHHASRSQQLFMEGNLEYWATLARVEEAYIKLSRGEQIDSDIPRLEASLLRSSNGETPESTRILTHLQRAAQFPSPLRGQHPADIPQGLRDFITKARESVA